ncbi:VOC family protein [Macrococcus sp. DPC7161]|uniref:VOC family protein n=1 Tax=Macrococcus sp. DPC7161 TaxID=2507060 RepID=UPI00100B697A|nr:VOC family protein [Macrococcus sp. DPC7161]RXK17581.1 VOC family protein [Macrococcus sp. DPC7161]
MKQLSPFIITDNVTKALESYQHAFGGEIKILNEHQGNVLHGELHVNDTIAIHVSSNYGKPFSNENVHIVMTFDTLEEEQTAFEKLCEFGSVKMPLEKTFFGSMHGHVLDELGVTWLFNYFF